MAPPDYRADPLDWGHGPRVFEMFLEPTCPFSVKAFAKMAPLIEAMGEDRITVKIRLLSQPWHLWSPIVTRCVLAASMGPEGKEAARRVLQAIADHREEFVFVDHATGPGRDTTPNTIIAKLQTYSGVALVEAFEDPELQREIKWHAKYARQNGIHVSPTFLIDGLVAPALSSGDSVEQWVAALS